MDKNVALLHTIRPDFILFALFSSFQEAQHPYVCGHSLVLMEHCFYSKWSPVLGEKQFSCFSLWMKM